MEFTRLQFFQVKFMRFLALFKLMEVKKKYQQTRAKFRYFHIEVQNQGENPIAVKRNGGFFVCSCLIFSLSSNLAGEKKMRFAG